MDRLANAEGMTRSELFRQAFRQYAERRSRWDQAFAYGEARAGATSLTEESAMEAVKKRRRARGRAVH